MKINKKLSVAIMISMLAFSLVGCGGKTNSMNQGNNNPSKGVSIPGDLEEKILNEGELTEEDVQKAMQQGIIERYE